MKIKPFFLACCVIPHLYGQINSYIGSYSGTNKDGYLQPVASLLTANFNAGIIPSSEIDSTFHVYFRLIGTGSLIEGKQLTYFNAVTPDPFLPKSIVQVPTILGPRHSSNTIGQHGLVYTFPAGLGLRQFIIAFPQISLSGIAGTELNARFFAYHTKGDAGKITLVSIGARHDIGRYFIRNKNIALSVGYFYNQADVGDYLHHTSHLIISSIGKHGKHWNYGFFGGYQKGTIHGTYVSTDAEASTVSYNLTNKNPVIFGLTAGLRFGALYMQLSAQGISPITLSYGLGIKF